MRVALYARVSTCNGQSPEMQLTELREYASRRGWEIFGEYVDLGVSGSKESRPELNRLMADAHTFFFPGPGWRAFFSSWSACRSALSAFVRFFAIPTAYAHPISGATLWKVKPHHNLYEPDFPRSC